MEANDETKIYQSLCHACYYQLPYICQLQNQYSHWQLDILLLVNCIYILYTMLII